MSLIKFTDQISSKFAAGGRCTATPDLTGRYAIVTGANTGIGLETAVTLARLGAHVVVASRDSDRTREAVKIIMHRSGSHSVSAIYIDLSDLKSIHAFADQYKATGYPLHLLINNAGIMMPPQREETVQGFERQFGINHLGHYLLTHLLLPILKASAPARVISLASIAHRSGNMDFSDLQYRTTPYAPLASYGRSKLANIMFSHELNTRMAAKGVTAYSVHPGLVRTDLARYCIDTWWKRALSFPFRITTPIVFKTPEEGAQTTLHCALSPLSELDPGKYYVDCRKAHVYRLEGYDADACERLWDESAKLVGVDAAV
ncbi:retinol dehydrogenase 13 [Piptocephalis cylindrospora]|uniref:Retinol dehydrogenase 13 n=1 Tax=Piptocephalis cylindrospora TaxID=1907219 RepID=A0A4P9Y3G1_9FUNG|nr:retinol dehydrogenase 13 [Piptocephalis cylindrospora]|eukprot:RKP13172.1 retinol dehydrogenase 13 [Piptocephalis cylindrospora]